MLLKPRDWRAVSSSMPLSFQGSFRLPRPYSCSHEIGLALLALWFALNLNVWRRRGQQVVPRSRGRSLKKVDIRALTSSPHSLSAATASINHSSRSCACKQPPQLYESSTPPTRAFQRWMRQSPTRPLRPCPRRPAASRWSVVAWTCPQNMFRARMCDFNPFIDLPNLPRQINPIRGLQMDRHRCYLRRIRITDSYGPGLVHWYG